MLAGCGDDELTLGDTVASAMDRDVDPCDDFYRYACGGWIADRADGGPRQSRGFGDLTNRNFGRLTDILERTTDPDIAQYYSACLDERGVQGVGLRPLEPLLESIDRAVDPGSVMEVAGELSASLITVLFDPYLDPALHDPERSLLYLGQGGLGLPDRSYYLADERTILDAYGTYAAAMLSLSGSTSTLAPAVVAFETELARTSSPAVELRVPEQVDHEIDLGALQQLAPLAWDRFFAALGVPQIDRVNVDVPSNLVSVARLIRETPPPILRAYLRLRVLDALAQHLPPRFGAAQDELAAVIYGPSPKRPRERLCASSTIWALRDRVGRIFVEDLFDAGDFTFAQEILAGVEDAFAAGLEQGSWLDDPTRDGAIAKVAAIQDKVGHPMPWPETMAPEPSIVHLDNVLRFSRDKAQRYYGRAGQPVDRSAWRIAVTTVNAYYSSGVNEIVFPAAILQLPFYAGVTSVPISFGGIGSVMGHELTHSLDDQGRKFTPDGRLEEWWSEASIAEFDRRAACVIDEYSAVEIQPGLFVDGRLTLGENIADLGGIQYAEKAYRAWAGAHGRPEPLEGIEELDDEQLLFVAFAQTWCSRTSAETERVLARTDVHSPPEARVNQPLTNLPAFHEAFGCAEGSPMRPAQQCAVW